MPDEHQPRRPFVFLWTQEYIHGTTRQELLPDERSIFIDFFALAGDSPKLGFVCVAEDVGYTDEQLARLLKVDIELLQRAKTKMVECGKIKINDGTDIIEVLNFWKYQPKFDRTGYQRRYMQSYREQQKAKGDKDDKSNG